MKTKESRDLAETILDVINEETNDYDAIDSIIKILDGYMIRSKTVVNSEMKVENCVWNIKWDYTGLEQHRKNDITISQKDWNQTIMTMINQLSARICKASFRGGAKFITAHPAMEGVFKTLEFYKDGDMGGGRYTVNFDDKVKYNEIFIYQEMWNKFHTIPITSVDDGGIPMLDFKDKTKCTDTEKIEFNSKLIGCITVDNYG